MSQDMDNIASNHLSAPVDAFDNFQASTVVEEDEYITLADIVSPEPSVPYLSGDPNEIPFDNEVILTNLDDQFSDANSQSSQFGYDDSHSVDRPHLDVSYNMGAELTIGGQDTEDDIGESHQQEVSVSLNTSHESVPTLKRRRGKKSTKKKPYSNEKSLSETTTETPTISQRGRKRIPKKIPEPIIEPPKTTRGRRYRQKNAEPTQQVQVSNENEVSDYNENIEDSTSKRSVTKPKRGRSKKNPQQGDPPLEAASVPNNKSPSKKRGRNKKVPVGETSNSEVQANLQQTSEDLKFADLEDIPVHTITNFNKLNDNTVSADVEESLTNNDFNDQDDSTDGIALSDLKTSLDKSINNLDEQINDEVSHSEQTEVNGINEYEVKENGEPKESYLMDPNESLLVEDTSKRPKRQRVKQKLVYDEGSDEDPFTNMEVSDDEPRRKKGKRYYSDDEYVPGRKMEKSSSDPSDSDIDLEEDKSKTKKKRFVKTGSTGRSPRKTSAKRISSESNKNSEIINVTTVTPKAEMNPEQVDDIEFCLQSSVIKAPNEAIKKSIWGNTFENFIANKIQTTSDLKIEKVSSDIPVIKTPLEIPVIDMEAKKPIDNSSQTEHFVKSTAVQTSSPYEVPMKDNVALTPEQSENACQFLKSIVGTTSELGQLMTQKSDDFIKKKINTSHVIDTFKMDYCVKKSFLLLKLAKHNIVQMEEDLSKKYEDFLSMNNLLKHREDIKTIAPKDKSQDDSDCEIVGESVPGPSNAVKKTKSQENNSKFNPKTVFLNKELSIKIAKKEAKPAAAQNSKEKLNIKGRHTVWISDSVMVKKVKPTQSFLAQDSRNKKPPDSRVTAKLVSDFFKNYYHDKLLSKCAQFTSPDWLQIDSRQLHCYYFVKSETVSDSCENLARNGEAILENVENGESNTNGEGISKTEVECPSPDTLSSLCTKAVQRHLKLMKPDNVKEICDQVSDDITDVRGSASPTEDVTRRENPQTLFRLCLNTLAGKSKHNRVHDAPYLNPSPDDVAIKEKKTTYEVLSLKEMCSKKLINLFSFVESCENSMVDNTLTSECNINEINGTSDLNHLADELVDLIDKIIEDPICKLIEDNYLSDNSMGDMIDDNLTQNTHDIGNDDTNSSSFDDTISNTNQLESNHRYDVRSLLSLCVELIGNIQKINLENNPKVSISMKTLYTPAALKHLAFDSIKDSLYESLAVVETKIQKGKEEAYNIHQVKTLASMCFERVAQLTATDCNNDFDYSSELFDHASTGLTINCVNTLTEEAFHNIEEAELSQNASQFSDEETNCYGEDFDQEYNMAEENDTEENNWLSQLQMEVTSGNVTQVENVPDDQSVFIRVKTEPLEEPTENFVDAAIVKTEPTNNLDQMTIVPGSVVTKQEQIEEPPTDKDKLPREKSFDSESFEAFVSTNKMMYNLDESSSDGIFSQSAFRVRRQFEPDYRHEADEFDPMSLLIPQTFEPLSIETAKNRLLNESSSDEGNKEPTTKKKPERRGRKPKKAEIKTKEAPMPKEAPALKEKAPAPKDKENPPAINELTVLTRRMREKIRQEEKKVESSDSEQELSLSSRREKPRKDNDKIKKSQKPVESEIQVNDVDSTEQVENSNHCKVSPQNEQFSGFTAVDQNEITSYQKYVKYVYDKILPKDSPNIIEEVPEKAKEAPVNADEPVNEQANDNDDRPESPLINYEDPVEMLECEPTMPIFDDEKVSKRVKKTDSKKTKDKINKEKLSSKVEKAVEAEPVYVEKDGWHCYSISQDETKLYKTTKLLLEKLPESFVQTYFRYQDIAAREKEDEDINRLINLNTLNRSTGIGAKDATSRKKAKGKSTHEDNGGDNARADSPNADNYAELTPSEDEGANIEDELPPPVRPTSENVLAKSSLMNENDSDSDSAMANNTSEQNEGEVDGKRKSRVSKKKVEAPTEHPENVMLTADMSMNKELNLLHAPVILKHDTEDISLKSQNIKKPKSGHKSSSAHDRAKNEDDSSSEEEKQWVTTKEKLLKRMGRKDTASLDDAKRTKLVTEFIERRGDEVRPRKGPVKKKRLSMRRRMEREKQLRVLSNELYDNTNLGQKKVSQSYFKGRRNIRKVIDKKSLMRSTVIANMEEFERKCRLNQRQARLRELLGLEEGVSVVVINDEVCLEYDFDENEPVVTVHPFFTKVMKAHQYEGVKFMWDACFESLEKVEAGSGGGGCILAHCMGLGKTLQVLALLHTVLTHPRVGMQRVLVCCPLSTVLNWVDEINKWIGPVTHQIKVFELSKLKKTYERAYQLEDWYNGGGIFIIGYELFRSMTTLDPEYDDVRPTIVNKIRTALLDPGPDIVVCDEGHLLKNDCSVLAVAMSRVKTKRRIILTGTPMQNNLREYYCMVNFVKPNLLGTYSEYSNRFENPIMNGQHRDSREEDIKLMKQRTHILHKVLEGCLQRQEASVLYPYLPKKNEYTVFISLTSCQWDLYKHYLQNYGKQSNKQSILRDFHILQKIWSHPKVLHNFQLRSQDNEQNKVKPEKLEDDLACEDLESEDIKPPTATEVWWTQYLDGGNMLDSLESSNKFVVVFRILEECISLGDKILIFSTSLITMDVLEYFLKRINGWSLGHEYYRLDGSVPPEVRQKWCREFNAEHNHKTKLFLISTRAGSLGLNMVAANRVIILDTSWNPAHDIQSIFRVYRFGQKKDCYIYRLVAMGTMEQKIYERSVTKQAVACRVVDEQQIDRHYNMAELTELYKYDDMGTSVAGGVAIGVTDVALLRVARHPALHAVHEHDSLLRGSSEQELPDHERAAAWMQFQEEHATKQMQNQLTSSFALHIPRMTLPEVPQLSGFPEHLLAQQQQTLLQPLPEVKTEPVLPSIDNMYSTTEAKGKKGKKSTLKVNIPIQAGQILSRPGTKTSIAREDEMVKKIVNLLMQHQYETSQKPKDIAALVSNVRKIVAYGHVPEKTFNNELTKSIADVLMGKEPSTLPVETSEPRKVRPLIVRRGRSRPIPELEPPEPVPSTSTQSTEQEQQVKQNVGRRRAAVLAEKNLASALESIIDIDDDNANDDAWQGNNSDSDYAEEIVPETPKADTPQISKTIKTEKTGAPIPITVTSGKTFDTITLSDDDAPPVKITTKAQKTKKDDPAKDKTPTEVIPLHPSLLSNKNFIKIVAHTYLEGNPMLDDDAANMAAQYSTTKALKEYESSGKPIVSGPIYDIATKVLGIDILTKLHKTNPKIKSAKPVEEPVQVKLEDSVSSATNTAIPKATPSKMPRVKAKGIEELMVKQEPKSAKKSVVPVGMYTRVVPTQPPVPVPQANEPEESILPDDDDVIINDSPTPSTSKYTPLTRKNAQPLLLNSVIAKSETTTPKIIKIIPGGRIVVSNSKDTKAKPSTIPSAAKPQAEASNAQDTICLDSDEEEPSKPTTKQPKRKMVALKSTAKLARGNPITISRTASNLGQPVPVSLTAANGNQLRPVPVSLTAANGNQLRPVPVSLTAVNGSQLRPVPVPGSLMAANGCQPEPVPVSLTAADPQAYPIPDNMTNLHTQYFNQQHMQSPLMTYNQVPNNNFFMQMPQGGMQRVMLREQYINPQSSGMTQTSGGNVIYNTPQGMTFVNPQQYHNMMASVPQGMMMNTSQPMNMMSHMNVVGNNVAPMSQNLTPVPQNTPPPLQPTTATSANKTVCKPGDILRITASGQVEILNKAAADNSSVVNKDETPAKAQPKPKVAHVQKESPIRPAERKERARKISSSTSSSSESSRASSPENQLSIFKDIVHIKSIDDILDSSRSKSIATKQPTTNFNKTMQARKPDQTIAGTKAASSTASLIKQISKTDTHLKKLDNVLGSTKQTSKNPAPKSAPRDRSWLTNVVDLDDDTPTVSKSVKETPKMSKPVAKSKQQTSAKPSTSKLVGTSKSIIISGSGKASLDNSAKKELRGKSEVKAPPQRQPEVKKRSAPVDNSAVKKRKEPMTLKDFDIDDIDDIIELE